MTRPEKIAVLYLKNVHFIACGNTQHSFLAEVLVLLVCRCRLSVDVKKAKIIKAEAPVPKRVKLVIKLGV